MIGGHVLGLGCDLCEVERVRGVWTRQGERFLEFTFTEGERAYCLRMRDPAPFLAARFAAKEAVIKALDLPEAGIGWRDIELTRGPGGRPALALHGRAAELARGLGVRDWAVSISHDGPQACAVVVGLLGTEAAARKYESFPSSV